MKIKYSCYKYAPETAAASVNGLKLNLNNTNIGVLIAAGNHAEAEKELKRVINDNGKIYLVSTWKLDTESLRQAYGEKAIWHDGFLIVEL